MVQKQLKVPGKSRRPRSRFPEVGTSTPPVSVMCKLGASVDDAMFGVYCIVVGHLIW
jgi:hypothetical protein